MLKTLCLLVCVLLVASQIQPLEADVLRTEVIMTANNLPAKYCPMRNFKGQLFCPQLQGSYSSASLNVDSEVDVSSNSGIEMVASDEIKEENIQPQVELLNPNVQMMNQAAPLSNGVISGYGFDRVKREVKFPGK
jgi:hypothetical protein